MSKSKSDQDRIREIQRRQLAMRDPGDSKIRGGRRLKERLKKFSKSPNFGCGIQLLPD